MAKDKILIHNLEGENYLENFLVSSVSAIFLIRFYLEITHYPQITLRGLHIAHMLWGGFLMMIAIVLLVSFLNRSVYKVAAVIGGIGFGAFIDELGKFITQDNNYFFEPTVVLIYAIFIAIFIVFRLLERNRRISKEEYIENAFELLRIAQLENSLYYKNRALEMLKKCNQSDPLVESLHSMACQIETGSEKKENPISVLDNRLHDIYNFFIKRKLVTRGIIALFVLYTLYTLLNAVDVMLLVWNLGTFALSFPDLAELSLSILSAVIVIVGVSILRFSHLRGYKMLRIAVLISVFFTQFFVFYKNQFQGVFSLLINLIVLGVLQYIINEEYLSSDDEDETSL